MSDPALPSLPRGWAWTPLGDLADVKLGKMLSPKAFEPGLRQLPYLRNENVRWFTIDTDDVKSMGFTDEEREKFQLRVGDLLVCEGGEPGRCAVVTESTADFMIQKALHRVRPRDGTVSARFLQYFFKRFIDAGTVIERRSETTIQHLPREKMIRVPVPVAPVPEQRRIVAKIEEIFSDLDAGVAALERVRANLKRYRAAVLKAAVEGRLTEEWRTHHAATEPAAKLLERILAERRAKWEQDQLRKFKEAGKTPPKGWRDRYEPPTALDEAWTAPSLPAEWTWCTIAQVAGFDDHSITDGPFGSNLKTEHYTDSGPRVIRLQNIGDGAFVDEYAHISESHYESLARHRLAAGDIVIAMMGEWLPRACPIPVAALPAIVKADCARFACNPSVGLTAYFNIALNAKPTRDLASRRIKGVGRPRLNLTSVRSIAIPLPPLAEQAEIVAEVDRRLSVADAAEMQVEHALQRAARLRQAILKRAFEGKLVPQDPTDKPAAALLERIKAGGGAGSNGHHTVIRNRDSGAATPTKRRSRARA